MADEDPFADIVKPKKASKAPHPDDPFADIIKPKEDEATSALENVVKPFYDYPSTARGMARESMQQFGRGVQQLAPSNAPLSERAYGVGNVAAGTLGYLGSPLSAAYRTFAGEPIEHATRGYIPKEWTEFALGMATPFPKFSRAPPAVPPLPYRPLDVTLSAGQEARDLTTIQREQAALRAQSGPPAQRVAQRFMDQQQDELARARQSITDALDPITGQTVAETPREAADIAQRGVQAAAARARGAVDTAYRQARAGGGEIHAGVFEGMPQKIKGDLSLGTEPVIIDPKLTPWANAMVDDLDQLVGRLNIPNRADPFGAPNAQGITGVGLEGVDQWRKRLSKFRENAFGSGNQSDGRAAQAVLDAFDNHIDAAVRGGQFTGNPSAVRAWEAARALHTDYRQTFRAQQGDPVGKVIEKIIGRGDRNPAAIPSDVADFIYGTAGTNPSSLNYAVVRRIRDIVGQDSQEWAAIRQGLFSKLTEAGEGVAEMGSGRVADRIAKFLNVDGVEMSRLLYTPAERAMIERYGEVMRHIQVPQAGANWSNTATFAGQGYRPSRTSQFMQAIGSQMGMLVTATLAGGANWKYVGLPYGVAEVGAAAAGKIARMGAQNREAAQIARQMPIVENVVRDFQRAQQAYEISPTARNAARVSLATRNLTTNLGDMGVDLKALQGPVSAGAEGEQP
jgi:hypothetical protein